MSHDRFKISFVIIFCQDLYLMKIFGRRMYRNWSEGECFTLQLSPHPSKKKRCLPYNQTLNTRRVNKSRINRRKLRKKTFGFCDNWYSWYIYYISRKSITLGLFLSLFSNSFAWNWVLRAFKNFIYRYS